MEKIIEKIKSSNIDYKSADFKAEIHFFGQIEGASCWEGNDGLFCEAFFNYGDKWQCLSKISTIQTQTGYIGVSI